MVRYTCVIALIASVLHWNALTAVAEEPQKVIARKVTLEEREASQAQWQPVVDLGGLEIGKPAKLTVVVRNSSGRTLRFDGFRSSCNCTVGSKVIKELKVNETAELQIVIDPQRTGWGAESVAKFTFYDTAKAVGQLVVTCNYKLKSFLAFSRRQYDLRVKDWEEKKALDLVQFPFEFTEPIEFDNLQVSVVGGLPKDKVRLVKLDNSGEVVVDLAGVVIPDSGLYGSVLVTDKVSGTVESCRVSITRVAEFDFSPETVVAVFDEKADAYLGSAVLAFNVNPLPQAPGSASDPVKPRFDSTATSVKITSKSMNPSGMLHRVYFEFPVAEMAEQEGAEITLRFTVGNKTFVHKCKFRLLR